MLYCFLFQDKVGKPKTTREPSNEAKGTVVSGGAIQVIQNGDKEVLTLRKPPDKATLNTYTPDTKAKEDELRKANNEVSNKDLAKSDVKNRTNKDVLKDLKSSKLIPVVCTARSVNALVFNRTFLYSIAELFYINRKRIITETSPYKSYPRFAPYI